MRYLRYALTAIAATALAAGPLPFASASAALAPTYQSSEPSKGEMMDHPPSEVTVTFSEPLDQSSWMNVLDECGNEIDAGPATVELNEMTVDIGKTPSGMYEVVYKAVGLAGATGSSTSTFEFMVHHGKPCSGKKKGGHDHPKKPGKGKGHDDHDKGRDEHDDHDDDDDDGAGGSGHSGHSGTSSGSGSSGHSGHDMGSSDTGNRHGTGHGRRGGGHTRTHAPGGGTGAGDETTLAGGAGGAAAPADAEAVLIGLGLALAVGVLGGWLLRMSGNLPKAT